MIASKIQKPYPVPTVAQAMVAISIVGRALPISTDNAQYLPWILDGSLDFELHLASYQAILGNLPSKEGWEEKVSIAVEHMKDRLRRDVQSLFEGFSEQQRLSAKAEVGALFKEAIAPSKHGTVDELAAKYKVSKSSIRRMKREGTLDNFIWSREVAQT